MGGPPRAARLHLRQHNNRQQRHSGAIVGLTGAPYLLRKARPRHQRPRRPLRRPHSRLRSMPLLPPSHLQRHRHRLRIPAPDAGHLPPQGRRHQPLWSKPYAGVLRLQVFQ